MAEVEDIEIVDTANAAIDVEPKNVDYQNPTRETIANLIDNMKELKEINKLLCQKLREKGTRKARVETLNRTEVLDKFIELHTSNVGKVDTATFRNNLNEFAAKCNCSPFAPKEIPILMKARGFEREKCNSNKMRYIGLSLKNQMAVIPE